jgi:ABC-type transport system involved in multi-copper enzyme maturation permease subunit
MNTTLVLSFWRQRLTSPIRLVLLAAAFGFPLLFLVFMPSAGFTPLGDATGLVLIFAVGMIGQDLSSGVLQLLFARPVRRAEYVVSRWLGVGLAAAMVGVAQVVLASAILAGRGAAPHAQDALLFAGQRALEAFGLAAVFALLSSLIGGVGDLALYFLGTIVAGVLNMAAQAKGWMTVARAASELQAFLTPRLDLHQLIATSPVPFHPIVSYASTVAVCLALAMLAIGRKELSYASS